MHGAMVVGEGGGHEMAMQQINYFFIAHQMLVAGFGARGYGRCIGDVKKDKNGPMEARELGRRVALLAQESSNSRSPSKPFSIEQE